MDAKEKLDRFSKPVISESALLSDGVNVGLEAGEGFTCIRVILSPDCPRFRGHSQSDVIP